MKPWIIKTLLALSVFGVVWAATVIAWQSNNRMPTTREIGLYFIGLPVLVLVLIGASIAIFKRVSRPAPNLSSTSNDPQVETSLPAAGADERKWALHMAGFSLRAAHGQSPDELIEAISTGATNLDLDDSLVDSDGFPIISGRIAALDNSGAIEKIQQWLAATGSAGLPWSEEDMRAMALGEEVFAETLAYALAHPLLADYLQAAASQRTSIPLPPLQVLACLPEWSEPHRTAFMERLFDVARDSGWPADKLLPSPLLLSQQGHPLQLIDRLCLATHRQALPCFTLLLACASNIGEHTVRQWADAGQLMTASNKGGSIPGEGAVAMLVMDEKTAVAVAGEAFATLHRTATGQREKSIDFPGRVNSDLAVQLCGDALAVAAIDAEHVGAVFSDADQRANRVAELLQTTDALLPQLDPATQVVSLASACGIAGLVPAAISLALAGHQAVDAGTLVLCFSNQDSHQRVAGVVRPYAANRPAAL